MLGGPKSVLSGNLFFFGGGRGLGWVFQQIIILGSKIGSLHAKISDTLFGQHKQLTVLQSRAGQSADYVAFDQKFFLTSGCGCFAMVQTDRRILQLNRPRGPFMEKF